MAIFVKWQSLDVQELNKQIDKWVQVVPPAQLSEVKSIFACVKEWTFEFTWEILFYVLVIFIREPLYQAKIN